MDHLILFWNLYFGKDNHKTEFFILNNAVMSKSRFYNLSEIEQIIYSFIEDFDESRVLILKIILNFSKWVSIVTLNLM